MESKIINKNLLGVVLITLFFTDFFGCLSFSQQLLFVLMLPFVILKYGKDKMYKPAFNIFLIGIFFNCISSYFYRGQSMINTLFADLPFMHLLFFYVIFALSPNVKTSNKALLILSFTYCIFYLIQSFLANYGIVLYSMSERANENVLNNSDGLFRLRIPGSALASLAIFYGINFYIKEKKIIYIALALIGLYVIVLMNFRSMLYILPLFSLFYLYKIRKVSLKSVGYILGIAFVLYIAYLNFQPVKIAIDSMMERAEENNFNDSEYIRTINLNYFMTSHFKSAVEYFLGSGMPYKAANSYAMQMIQLADFYKIFWVDWGLLGLSWLLGVLPVTSMVYCSIIAFKRSDTNTYYLSVWLLFLIFCSITSKEFYREGNLEIQALVLYIIYRSNKYEYRHINI